MTDVTVSGSDWHISKDIVLCSICKGSGVYLKEELTDYHRGDYDTRYEFCATCGGEGRMIECTYTARVRLELPNNSYTDYKTIKKLYSEKLDGRKTQDIYKIGRIR